MEIFWGVIGFFGFVLLIALNCALTATEVGEFGEDILSRGIEDSFNVSSGKAKVAAMSIILVLWIVALVIIAATAQAIFGEAPAREF